MIFNLFNELICGGENPKFLIFDFSTAPPLLFYSYIPIVIISLILSIFIFLKDKKSLQSRLLLLLTTFFSLWVLNILIQWISSYHTVLMFAWQITAFFEVGIYISAFYFSYVFLFKRDLEKQGKIILILIMCLVSIFTPSQFNIELYDIGNCEGIVGGLWSIIYIFEPLVILSILYIGFLRLKFVKDLIYRKQIIIFTASMVSFLFVFFISNFYGELTRVYEFNLWGPIGMLVFLSLLTYLIFRFRIFNVKLFASEILMFLLTSLIFSLFFVRDESVLNIIISITFLTITFFGVLLVKSVKREIEQREHIEVLAGDLSKANARLIDLDKQKSEFVSFATHQLRAPLTAMKGYTSLILEGELGQTSPEVKKAVGRIFDSSNTLTNIVNDYLNISRIELGTMKYTFDTLDLRELTENVIGELKPNIEAKGLKFSFSIMENSTKSHERFMVHADKDKLKQVVANLIDNSVKYTPAGSVTVSISKNTENRKILLSIKDTGVGISHAVMPKLFSKFVRADSANKENIYGTGLGLYIAKQIIIAHQGKLWAESLGDGKGSTFFLELDMEV